MKRNSVLRKRLKDIEREISAVNRGVKTLSRNMEKAEGGVVSSPPAYPPRQFEPRAPTAGASPAPAEAAPAGGDLFPPGGNAAGSAPVLFSHPAELQRQKDRRFANYFASSNMDAIRPLRQERNVQRNKAILMVVVLILVMLWLYYKFFW